MASSVNAQVLFPITVTPTLTPPYSLSLSDYSKFGSQKLMVTVYANDLSISNLPIKLRIKMETVGVTIENPPTITTVPIYINGGETNILFGNNLDSYFNINNLIFKGYSKNTYNRTGQLPEGFYRFTVEVLHFNTNRLISNQGTTTAWITLGKPPVLKLPENNVKMGQYKGIPLTFSWLSSNVGSPISANTIQYKFEMWEMHVPGINPNVVAATTPVFHEYSTFSNVYTLYPNALLMTPGMQYAWRVTASDLSGFVPFEQNGHSEIRTFTYKSACESITNLGAKNNDKSGYFKWDTKDNHTSFNIEMRNPSTNWTSNSESFENKAEFFDLEYGSAYEMRVQAVCDGDPDSKSDFSEWETLKIPFPAPPDTADCPDCDCNKQIPDTELQNFELRKDLEPGDIINSKTGTTRFIIKTVESQGDGVYKGVFLFWSEIWKLKFICKYWDLQVNTDDVIVNMEYESIYNPQFLVDVDATMNFLDSLRGAITTLTSDTTIEDTLTVSDPISTIYVNDGDSVIVVSVDENGNSTETVISNDADDIKETLIIGENGEEYVVTKGGQVMGVDEYKNTGGGKNSLVDEYTKEKEENGLSDDITVEFSAKENQKYGFDEFNDEKNALLTQYPSLNNGYQPAYKSVSSFNTDIVGASNVGNNIIFKDDMGIPAVKTGDDIIVRGASGGSEVPLYAYQQVNDTTQKIAGKLNIKSYDEQSKKLFIVPVNGAKTPTAADLQNTLNKIYSQAVTKWEVVKLDDLKDVTFENGDMTHGGSSAITVYNKDQKALVNRFIEAGNSLESNAYYLFFVENVQFKESSIAGYMPLQRQIGFIYENPSLNTVAHELGHGAFNLFHTFSTDNYIAAEHSTQNLMDYKGGKELWKHQWDLIHNPQNMLFAWAQDESEGEMRSEKDKFCELVEIGNWIDIQKNNILLNKVFFYNISVSNDRIFNDNVVNGYLLYAYKLWCKFGLTINFVQTDNLGMFSSVDGYDPNTHYGLSTNLLGNADIVFYYGKDCFGVKGKIDPTLKNKIEANCSKYIETHSGGDFRMCLVEIFLNTVARHNDIEDFMTDRCGVSDIEEEGEEVEVEEVEVEEEEEEKEEEIVISIRPITNITTFIDLEGNIEISWINPNLDCTTKLKYLIPGKEPKEIDLTGNTSEEYSYTIDKLESGLRLTGKDCEIVYIISITNPNLNFMFQSKTGKFQGHDHVYCTGLYVKVGRKENLNEVDYNYLWTDDMDEEVPEIQLPDKGYVGFYIKQSRILKIKRTKKDVTDIALVKITAKDGCDWEIFAKDTELPKGSGKRIVGEGGTLEVVQNKAEYGVEAYVSEAEYRELYWRENEKKIPDSYKKLNVKINTKNKEINSTTPISAEAFKQKKKVNVKVYELDKVEVPLEKLDLDIDDYCDFINDINDRLNFIQLGKPLSCMVTSKVYSYNAEKFNSPEVVRDETGEIIIGITVSAPTIGIPPVGTPQLTITFSGGGGPTFLYDKRKRIDSKEVMPPDKMLGSRILIGVEVCGTLGVSVGPYTLAEAGICGNGSINFDFSEPDGCMLYLKASMDDIVGFGYVEFIGTGKMKTDEVKLLEGIESIYEGCIQKQKK